jgi:hypothetical protein
MIHSDYFNAHSLGNYLSIVRAFAKPGTPAAAAAPLPVDVPRFALGGGRPCVLSESEWTPTIAAVKAKCDALSGTLQATAARPPRLQGAIPCRAGYRPAPHRAAPSVGFVITGHVLPCLAAIAIMPVVVGAARRERPESPLHRRCEVRRVQPTVGGRVRRVALQARPLPRAAPAPPREGRQDGERPSCVAGMRGGHAWRACVAGMRGGHACMPSHMTASDRRRRRLLAGSPPALRPLRRGPSPG